MVVKSKKISDTGGLRNRGFSLIELMIAMAVGSIVMAAIYSVYSGLTRSYTTHNVAADIQQAVRATIDFMAEDIMMAGFNPQEASFEAIEYAGSTKIQFKADKTIIDGIIGGVGGIFEDITYELVGTQLRQTDPSASPSTEALIDNVTSLQFKYYNAASEDLINVRGLGDPLGAADRADIRTVEISITVAEPAGRSGTIERTYTTRIRCRNIGI
jgi:type IV pilus assembly protein PilW